MNSRLQFTFTTSRKRILIMQFDVVLDFEIELNEKIR